MLRQERRNTGTRICKTPANSDAVQPIRVKGKLGVQTKTDTKLICERRGKTALPKSSKPENKNNSLGACTYVC